MRFEQASIYIVGTTHSTQCTPAFLLRSWTAPMGWNFDHVCGTDLTSARMRHTRTSISPSFAWQCIIPSRPSSSAQLPRGPGSVVQVNTERGVDVCVSGPFSRVCALPAKAEEDAPVVCRFANLNNCRVVGFTRMPDRYPLPPGEHQLPPASRPSINDTKRRCVSLQWSCHSIVKF